MYADDTTAAGPVADFISAGSAYAAAATAFQDPDRKQAVLALELKMRALPDAVLHTIVAGVEPAGPHVGNPGFSADLLRELARFTKEQREAKLLRENETRDRRWSFARDIALVILGGAVTLLTQALLS